MSKTKKITNIITPNGEDLQLTDSEAVHKENNIITEKITLANQLEFVPSNENTDSSLPTSVLSMDEINGGLRIDGKVVQGDLSNIASGLSSHAEGQNTSAEGDSSHAEGIGGLTTLLSTPLRAIGLGSHAEGQITTAQGNYSHAEGSLTKTIGNGAHAEGNYTSANGQYSHTEGDHTIAIGQNSHAEGYYTKALENYQHVSGKYNTDNSDALFIIGNGTSDVNRKNALEVLADGTINLSPDKAKITNVANPTDDYDAVNKWYIDNKFIFTIDNIQNMPYINTEGVTFQNNTINLENGSITFYFGNCFVQGTYQKNQVIIVIDGVEVQSESGLLNQSINTLTIYPENMVGNITFDDLIITNNKNTNFILSSSLSSYINQLEQRIAALEQRLAAQSNS